jgi:hypothetical protein
LGPPAAPLTVAVLPRKPLQVSSACACERSWADYDFIHSKRRNRLLADRARDLVYVFSNMRLADKQDKVEGYVGWDVACNESDVE